MTTATTPETSYRPCQRLLAIIRQHGNAESLHTVELIALSDWICQPTSDEAVYAWAEELALPVIRELGRRLAAQCDTQALHVPALLAQVHAMRTAQVALSKAKSKSREEKLSLAHQLAQHESAIDHIIAEHYQPSLFS